MLKRSAVWIICQQAKRLSITLANSCWRSIAYKFNEHKGHSSILQIGNVEYSNEENLVTFWQPSIYLTPEIWNDSIVRENGMTKCDRSPKWFPLDLLIFAETHGTWKAALILQGCILTSNIFLSRCYITCICLKYISTCSQPIQWICTLG